MFDGFLAVDTDALRGDDGCSDLKACASPHACVAQCLAVLRRCLCVPGLLRACGILFAVPFCEKADTTLLFPVGLSTICFLARFLTPKREDNVLNLSSPSVLATWLFASGLWRVPMEVVDAIVLADIVRRFEPCRGMLAVIERVPMKMVMRTQPVTQENLGMHY